MLSWAMSAEQPIGDNDFAFAEQYDDALIVPVISLSKEDLFYCREDLTETILALTPSQLARIADRLNDALQDSYWTAMGIILTEQFGIGADNEDEAFDADVESEEP